MSSWVIWLIEINFKPPEIRNRSIIWRQHLTMQINGGGQIGIVVQNIDTSNTSAVEKKEKGITYCACDTHLWLSKLCHTYHAMEHNI